MNSWKLYFDSMILLFEMITLIGAVFLYNNIITTLIISIILYWRVQHHKGEFAK